MRIILNTWRMVMFRCANSEDRLVVLLRQADRATAYNPSRTRLHGASGCRTPRGTNPLPLRLSRQCSGMCWLQKWVDRMSSATGLVPQTSPARAALTGIALTIGACALFALLDSGTKIRRAVFRPC